MPADSNSVPWNRLYWAVAGYTVVLVLLLYLIS